MKKIMFNDKYGLTEAVFEGRKTQTRRICAFGSNTYEKAYRNLLSNHKDGSCFRNELLRCSLYKVGEEVAIAQSYNTVIQETFDKGGEFKGSCSIFKSKGLDNKMFVRADLMPHRIKITNIRVERLQDISEDDCLKEGVYYHTEPPKHHEYDRYSPWSPSVKPYKFESEKYFCSAKYAFKHLIEKVSGKGTWESNPYVFVYEFRLIQNKEVKL